MAHLNKLDQFSPLPVLFREARRLDKLSRGYLANALSVWLELGRILTLIKSQVGNRKWKERRQEYFPDLNPNTDKVCRRLDAHRALIEQAREKNPGLSINGAIALIPTNPKAPKAPKPAALEKWGTLSTADKAAGIAHEIAQGGVEKFLNFLSAAQRQELADRLPAKACNPPEVDNAKAHELVCQALALLHNKSSNKTDGMRAKLTSAAAVLKPLANKKAKAAVSAPVMPSGAQLDHGAFNKALGPDRSDLDAVLPAGTAIH
jgi:hypothetical protein